MEHCSNYAELARSANAGCELCALFRIVLLEYYAHSLCKTTAEAESYHRARDEAEIRAKDPAADANSNNISDSTDDIIEAEPTSFVVRPVNYDIILQTGRESLGLQGILYVRRHSKYQLPLKDVWPFLSISSLSGTLVTPK